MTSFTDYADEVLTRHEHILTPQHEVDAFEFLTSSEYLNEDPTPFQRVTMKTLYGLWEVYGVDEEEQNLIDLARNRWRINIDVNRTSPVKKLVLALGRRSAKSSTLSFIASYAMYSLICKGNPQKYYGIRERHPIYATHVAAAGKQAQQVFTLTSDNIRKVPFFRPYIDFEKDNSSELRLYSPYDLYLNEQIRQRNKNIPRGYMKESLQHGSLNVRSITTSATTSRGDAVFLLMLSEFAHFQRAKRDPSKSDEQVVAENPKTDYAVDNALTPSVMDFGEDGKVIYESSPAEKGGEFYHQYCIAGGMEQEGFERVIPDPDYAVMQFASWEVSPVIKSRQQLDSEFRTNPTGANMEYGAHFGNPSGNFITEELINSIPVPDRPIIRKNLGPWKFVITLDPGGRAKSKEADTYALAWGHYEQPDHGDRSEENWTYFVDGLHGFDAENKSLGGGRYERILVDPNIVTDYIVDLVRDIGGRNYVLEICYDQWQSSGPVSTLESLGLPAIETTFTNPYKAAMYENFLTRVQLGKVKSYGIDEGGWLYRFKTELKYLQQDTSGNMTYYHHPSSGPVQTDDYADVVANLIHRLVLRAAPTMQSIRDAKNNRQRPTQRRQTVRAVRGPGIALPGSRSRVIQAIRDRH